MHDFIPQRDDLRLDITTLSLTTLNVRDHGDLFKNTFKITCAKPLR